MAKITSFFFTLYTDIQIYSGYRKEIFKTFYNTYFIVLFYIHIYIYIFILQIIIIFQIKKKLKRRLNKNLLTQYRCCFLFHFSLSLSLIKFILFYFLLLKALILLQNFCNFVIRPQSLI